MPQKEKNLYIGLSALQGCGEGLYTSQKIKAGERICDFAGTLIGKGAFAKILEAIQNNTYNLENANYYVSLSSGLILDSSASNCFARYANDAEGPQKDSRFKNNAKIMEGEDKISAYLVALEDIPAGSEIFAAYGKSYWKGFI